MAHYIDVIMTTIASQITSLTVVYSPVYSDADQRKHQSSASLAFVWGIHRDRWIPRTKGQLRGKCFHLMTSSCIIQCPITRSNVSNLECPVTPGLTTIVISAGLVLVNSGADWILTCTTIISLLGFTENKSSAFHNGWQPRYKWTSQIWNVAYCLGALDRGQLNYPYDMSQLLTEVISFRLWVDKLLIFFVILVWQRIEKIYEILIRCVYITT